MHQQSGYSFQPGHSAGFYIPTMPQGQRAFIAQPVGQMTRPRWQSAQVRQMQGNYPQPVGQVRGAGSSRPRHPGNAQRRDAPYQAGMSGTRSMTNQQIVRPGGPVAPQRATYKLNSNTRNQYPAQQVIPPQQPEQSQIVMQVCVVPISLNL